MKLKIVAVAALLAIGSVGAQAGTPIVLTPGVDPDTYSADFNGKLNVNTFDLNLTGLNGVTFLEGQVSANFTGSKGYNVTAVTFDGFSFTPVTNSVSPNGKNGSDYWTLSLGAITSTMHSIVVTGTPLGGSTVGFVGSLSLGVTPVPEPETYAMMLAGLGALGFLARRRNNG